MPILKLNDAEIYYEVHGSGPPFLFLSETACDGEVWKIYQVPEFSRDHTVVTFDYRGMGQSSKPSTKYSMEMFADDAAAILDQLKLDQAIVCGHSMGGRVAQVLALNHPPKVKKADPRLKRRWISGPERNSAKAVYGNGGDGI